MLPDFINSLKINAEYRDILSHYHYLPEKAVEYVAGDAGLSPGVAAGLERLGIPRLYAHQGQALAHIRAGKDLRDSISELRRQMEHQDPEELRQSA